MRISEDLIAGAKLLGIALSQNQITQFQTYADFLIEQNVNLNLTSAKALEDIESTHFLDSLTLFPFITNSFNPTPNLIDIGSGAGFPGIPLKICLPYLHVTLVEATAKKATFLNQLISKLELSNVSVITKRAEVLAHEPCFREQYLICTARAVGSLPTVLELTLPFVHVGGLVLSPRGIKAESEAKESASSASTLGGVIRSVNVVDERLLLGERSVITIEKLTNSPAYLPRRVGMAKKRPLV